MRDNHGLHSMQIPSRDRLGQANNCENMTKILHSPGFRVLTVLQESKFAIVMKGALSSRQALCTSDQRYLGSDNMVVVKQFKFLEDQSCFRKELKLLKRIKRLGLENNGGFPVVLSAKTTKNYGEIMMSFVGPTIEKKFELDLSLERPTNTV